jgi:hypothetical protein
MKPIFQQISLITLSTAAVLVSACGGGGSESSTTNPPAVSNTSASLTVGPINGFGSVIVNGVRFDDSAAQVKFEDDEDRVGQLNSGLQIGMVVALKGERRDDSTGSTNSISTEAELRGPVQSVTTDSLVVMGQTIKTSTTTSYIGIADLTALKAGDIVQVHGLMNSAAEITAFLIVGKDSPAKTYKTVGKVSAHDMAAKTFKIGELTLSYGNATEQRKLPTGSWDGLVLRVRGASSSFTASPLALQASRIKQHSDFGEDSSMGEAEVRGFVSELAADKASFKANGVEVKLTQSTQILPANRSRDDLANGVLVEAEGSWDNGVLTARKIKFEDENEFELELKGAISDFVQNADGTMAFTVRNQAVITTTDTKIDLRGRASALANGMVVQVKAANLWMASWSRNVSKWKIKPSEYTCRWPAKHRSPTYT